MISVDIIILGGGWAGVLYGLECKLKYPDINIIILEKHETAGGLLRSDMINGHVFDIGGSHIIFSRNRVILDKMLSFLENDVFKSSRKSFVMLSRNFVTYPIENNLNELSQEDKIDALISFLEACFSRTNDFIPKNLLRWIYFFGKWIAENYLVPYNMKIWKRPLEEIDVDWVYTPGRLPIPDWRDVVKSAIGQPTIGYREQSKFYYPGHGGIQRLFDNVMRKAVESGVCFIKGYKIKNIKRANEGWIINKEIYAKKLVNSVPLNELVKLMDAPEYIIKLSNNLDYNRVLVVGLAIDRPAPNQHWIYVPTAKVIFHRYAWISNYSPNNAPPDESTLIAEITIPPSQPVNTENYVEETLKGLEKLEVIKDGEVLFTRSWLHEYGYPIHTITSNKAREGIIQWLSEQDVTLIGRWGCWKYWNMDKVYEEVLNVIKK
ncbi:NAD(P)-binding protein [Candidatus Bathyarchaeota archaeon]|nr:NAD(P)-binding protein [Candidatus Bathyarchaeota archaeon]